MLRIVLLIVFVLVPVVNFGLPPLLTDGNQFADDPQTRVAAAGYAFSIWGVIFFGMLAFSAWLVFGREPDSRPLRIAIIALIVAGIASIAFVPISIYAGFTVGWFDILAHLIPLTAAHVLLRQHVGEHPESLSGRWTYFGPSMYFGWITAATVISTSLMAYEQGIVIPDSTATAVSIAVLITLAIVGSWLTWNRDPIYGGTVCWALIAVGVKQADFPAIRYVAWSAAAIVSAVIVYQMLRSGSSYYWTKPSNLQRTTMVPERARG